MTERFTLTNPKNAFQEMKCGINDKDSTLTFNEVVDILNTFNDENEQLKKRIKELEIENQGQSDAIDGLQGFIAHFDLEDILND